MSYHSHHSLIFNELNMSMPANYIVNDFIIRLFEVNVNSVQHFIIDLTHNIMHHFLITHLIAIIYIY
jgi:hypothetical protein